MTHVDTNAQGSMRKWFNILLYTLAVILAIAITGIIIAGKPLPEGDEGPAAEALADSMLNAVNYPAWESLRFMKWTVRGKRHYIWDRWYNLADIRFDDVRVIMSLNVLEGRAWKDDVQLAGEEKRKWLRKAWRYWCADFFWLNPVAKIRDEGTLRRLVRMPDGTEALLVTFTQGGLTPGDSFLFVPDDEYLPVRMRMWVSILPVKGIAATFEEWTSLDGARIALRHRIGPWIADITNLRYGDYHGDLDIPYDPFTDF
jgi:hypothetical protein